VHGEDGALLGGDPAEREQLVVFREHAGRVGEACREAEGALPQRAARDVPERRELGRVGRPRVIAHHGLAHRAAHQKRGVEQQAARVERVEQLAHRSPRIREGAVAEKPEATASPVASMRRGTEVTSPEGRAELTRPGLAPRLRPPMIEQTEKAKRASSEERTFDRTLEGAEAPAARAFLEFLASVRPAVEAGLETRWDEKLQEVSRYGREVTRMVAEARALTLRGGKRFRAGLLVAAHLGVAPDAAREPAIDAAVALEFLQTYLLIQDDWIDDDPMRRGGPSVHAALGEALGDARLGAVSAILASDFTWGLAVSTLAGAPAPASAVNAAVRAFCQIHADVVVGQHLDTLGRAEDVEQMHALKTGSYTVRGPLCIGATLAGATGEVLAALDAFAAPVGVAFQLRDDLLGTFGSEAETGKPVGNDLRAGKRTAVVAAAKGLLDEAGRKALAGAFGRKDAPAEAVAEATAALTHAGARRAVEARLAALCGEAVALAEALPLTAEARRLLAGAAGALHWRGA